MNRKAVAIEGSYRRNGITEQVVDAILASLQKRGFETEKIVLTEKRIEFCKNCRACTQDPSEKRRGVCVIQDDMEEILTKLDAAEAIVLAAPVNFSASTAIMKRFVERLICYAYWPWDKMIPVNRTKDSGQRAVLVTSSGAPAIINRLIMPGPMKTLKVAAGIMAARVVDTLYLGSVGKVKDQRLSEGQLKQAESAAEKLAG